jgi:hypothetical protein
MIQIDLPIGPASPLVRGLAACLSSVTEVPLAELPEFGDLPMAHALASWLPRTVPVDPAGKEPLLARGMAAICYWPLTSDA